MRHLDHWAASTVRSVESPCSCNPQLLVLRQDIPSSAISSSPIFRPIRTMGIMPNPHVVSFTSAVVILSLHSGRFENDARAFCLVQVSGAQKSVRWWKKILLKFLASGLQLPSTLQRSCKTPSLTLPARL
jgi:hypothetical protein